MSDMSASGAAGKGKRSAVITLIALFTAAAILAGFSVAALLRRGETKSPSQASAGTDGAYSSGGASPSRGAQSAPGGTGAAAETPAAAETVPEADVWADYPSMFSSKQVSYEDAGAYLYWEQGERIYRMPKEGGEPELMVNKGELRRYGIENGYHGATYPMTPFAVAGDWLYFACPVSEGSDNTLDRFAYFRLPIEGGEPEHLFTGDRSCLQSGGGSLYMMFAKGAEGKAAQLASYTPGADALPRHETLDEFDSGFYIPDFVIRNGLLYYEFVFDRDMAPFIRTYDLAAGETDTLYVSSVHGDYPCYWQFFTEDKMYSCKIINEDQGFISVAKQNISISHTTPSEIITAAKSGKSTLDGQVMTGSDYDGWMITAPLAGRLLYSTGHNEETGEYTYALAPFGDEHHVIRTLTTTSRISLTCGPWAFFTGGVLDGRTGEIIPIADETPMFTLDSLLPAYGQAAEVSARNPDWVATLEDPWLLPN